MASAPPMDALADATIELSKNSGVNCARYSIAPKVASTDNELHQTLANFKDETFRRLRNVSSIYRLAKTRNRALI